MTTTTHHTNRNHRNGNDARLPRGRTKKYPASAPPPPNLEVEDVAWLWPHRIAVSHIALIAGTTDAGKTLVVDDVVARVTTGAKWPDGVGRAPLGEVLVFCEDPIKSVQNPRLIAAGADLRHIRRWPVAEPFYIDHDLNELDAYLKAHPRIRLVVFDPIGDHLIAQSYTKTRKALGDLLVVARERGVAVIGVGHPPKGIWTAPIDSFGGSRGITSRARLFWIVVRDDDDRRLLLHVKGNLTPQRTGLEFKSVGRRVEGISTEAPCVSWIDGPVELIANDWWALELQRKVPAGAMAEAKRYLEELLKDGQKPAAEVLAGAATKEITRGTLHRAKVSLGIKVEKHATANGPWVWALPKAPTPVLKSEPAPTEPQQSRQRQTNESSNLRKVPGPQSEGLKIRRFQSTRETRGGNVNPAARRSG